LYRLLGKTALLAEKLKVRLQHPIVGLAWRLWLLTLDRPNFDQVIEEMPKRQADHPISYVLARGAEVRDIDLHERLYRRSDLRAESNPMVDEEVIELTALTQDMTGVTRPVPLFLEMASKAVEERSQWSSTEMNERPTFLVEILEHGNTSYGLYL